MNKFRSKWGIDKNGSYQATLRKSSIEKWDGLFKIGLEVPINIEVWYEMEEMIAKEEGNNNYESPDDYDNVIIANKKRKKGKENDFVSFVDNNSFKIVN